MQHFKVFLSLFLISLPTPSSFGQRPEDVEIPYTVNYRAAFLINLNMKKPQTELLL